MKRSTASRWDGRDDTRGAPPVEEAPCSSLTEVNRRYRHHVVRWIRRRLLNDPSGAEDVLHEALVRLDQRIRDEKRVPHPVLPVLIDLAYDQLRNHVRAEKRRRLDYDDAPDSGVPTSKPNPEQIYDQAEHSAELRQKVATVFEQMRTEEIALVRLASVEETAQKEHAAGLGITEDALKKRLRRARGKFRTLYVCLHGAWRSR